MWQTCVGPWSPARRRKHGEPRLLQPRSGWRSRAVEEKGLRGRPRSPWVRRHPQTQPAGCSRPPPSPGREAGFSGNRVVFIYRDFEWPDHSVMAAALAPGNRWEIAWDGFYLWKGNWDSHPANPQQSLPSLRRTYKGVLV